MIDAFTKKSYFTFFDPKYLENTLEILLNQSIITKKPKNNPKTRNPPGTKILPALRYVVLGVLKVKKKFNLCFLFNSNMFFFSNLLIIIIIIIFNFTHQIKSMVVFQY
jgi:hypothetical protein